MSLNSLQLARSLSTITETFTLTGGANYDLPSTGVKAGQMVLVTNDTANNSILTIRSSASGTIETIRTGHCILIALQDSPTLSTHWRAVDTYEDGTFTPIIQGSTTDFTSVTYTEQRASFCRHNKLVSFGLSVLWTAASGGSGLAMIGGLPYATAPTEIWAVPVIFSNLDFSDPLTQIQASGEYRNSANQIYALLISTDNSTWTNPSVSLFTTGTFGKSMRMSGTYKKA